MLGHGRELSVLHWNEFFWTARLYLKPTQKLLQRIILWMCALWITNQMVGCCIYITPSLLLGIIGGSMTKLHRIKPEGFWIPKAI
jgi:hypothetical protein